MHASLIRLLQGALAVAFGFVLAVGLGEILLRAFWPQRSPVTIGMFEEDAFAGYRLRSNYRNYVRVPEYTTEIWTDSEGYRIAPEAGSVGPRAAAAEPAPGTLRLLAIGDSFTFGVGVSANDAFPHRLEKNLDGASPSPWSVRNGGVGGYGPLRSSRLLFSSQASWEPDVLVQALYVGNDLEDPNPEGYLIEPRIKNGRMITFGQSPLMRLRLFLRTRSHFYSFLRERLYGAYSRSGLAQKSQYLDSVGLREWTTWIQRVSWPAGQEALRETADWCRDHDVRYLVVLIPTRYQVDEGVWARYREVWGLPDEAFDRDHAQRELVTFLEGADVPVLDLLPEFRRRTEAGEHLYYEFDRHWNPEGHRCAAEMIAARLDALGWLSDADSRREVVRAAGSER